MRRVRMAAVAIALMTALFVTAVPETAMAASAYDNAYQTTDHLTVGGTVDGTPVCESEDVTKSWRQVIANSSSNTSFNAALNNGSWSVTENYTYNNSNSWQKIVDVYWAEDEPLQISFGYMGWGGNYSVNVAASAANKLHYGQIKVNYDGVSGLSDCAVYFYEFDNSIYNFQGSSISWTLPNGAPSLHNFFVSNGSISYPSGYEGAAIREVQPQAKFVAMGDSFSSGEGNERFEYGTDQGGGGENRCHRSIKAYPRLLQDELNLGPMAFVACSGATTSDLIFGSSGAGSWGEGSQLDALSDETEAVTLTIGGNDVGFSDFAKKCVSPLNLPGDDICDEYTDVYDDIMSAIANDLPGNLESVYGLILDAAPNADIYVAGYPVIAPWMGSNEPFDQDCGGLYDDALTNTWGDARAAYDVVTSLNAAIETAVLNVNVNNSTTRLHYVNVESGAFTGHDICQVDSYFNGIDIFNPEYSIHPNYDGQVAYAADFEAEMS